MAVLTHIERQKLEKALGMEGGYVLSFSNRTFEEFFHEVVGIDICHSKYQSGSGSKANRMRTFWDVGSPKEILALLEGMLEAWEIYGATGSTDSKNCISGIFSRLQNSHSGSNPAPTTHSINIEELTFSVALSFPGTHREYVEPIARILASRLGKNQVFYDKDYQAHLARPNLDILLQRIYHNQSSLVVVFLASGYAASEWCGLEWRAIRDILKRKRADQLMFVRLDNSDIDGTFSIDGYIDAKVYDSNQVAEFVLQRAGIPQQQAIAPKEASKIFSAPSGDVTELREALRVIQHETKFLWLEIIELSPPKSSCSAEVKRSTITRLGGAIKHLEDNGHFRFSATPAYDMVTTKEPVFIVTLEGVSHQLVNIARKLEEREPRTNR